MELPFKIEKDDHFQNHYAVFPNGMKKLLSITDVILLSLIEEIMEMHETIKNQDRPQ